MNYKNCKSYEIIKKMMKSKSGQDLLLHYERPTKELLERFMKNQSCIWKWFLFMNAFVYSCDERTKYIDLMSEYDTVDIALFLSISKQFHDEIRIVLEHLIKYGLLSKEEEPIVTRIIARRLDEEL